MSVWAPAAGRPLVMGIVNVTPDSFSDGGEHLEADRAIAHGRSLIAAGADIIDVGGESTRPGASAVDIETERSRVIPVVSALASLIPVSIDTTKPEVARAAVAAGARLINDVSATLAPVAGELGVDWIAMHRQGTPANMQDDPIYGDVVAEVFDALAGYAIAGDRAGVPCTWLDPGFGFGKTTAHNLALLAALPRLVTLGRPVVIGMSRKRTLGELLARSDGGDQPVPPRDRLEGTLASGVWAMVSGVRMLRVHDVQLAAQAARVVGERTGGRPPGNVSASQVV